MRYLLGAVALAPFVLLLVAMATGQAHVRPRCPPAPPCTRISATPRHGPRRGPQGVAATRPARHLSGRRASWTTLAAWHHESIYP